jgi:omega-6 fatty acid desaturase (delta-12 desaturase)
VGPNARRASLQLVTTLIPLAALMYGIHLALAKSVILALLLGLPTAGLLIRTFIFMHDCAHGSFFASRVINDSVGFITGVITFTSFTQWRRDHALHHASSGDLDRRGYGDIPTWTVTEYLGKSFWVRFGYRLARHPVTLLLGAPLHLIIVQRFRGKTSIASTKRHLVSGWMTNIAIAGFVASFVLLAGWKTTFFAYVFPFYLSAITGVWLFYVQHQFEDAYWARHDEWSYAEAAIRGSSHLKLPRILQWFTGNIGLHHVHHVAPRIPNYRLQACHDSDQLFAAAPTVTLSSGISALRLALWDEDSGRLVPFSRLREIPRTEQRA